jgi:hypothetical protein
VIGFVFRRVRPLLLGFAVLLLLAPAAGAASRSEILRDCETDGVLDGSYKPNEIRDARNNIPDDIDEYTDCRDVLSRATLGAGSSGGGGGGGNDPAAGASGGPTTGGGGAGEASGAAPPSDSASGGGGSDPSATPEATSGDAEPQEPENAPVEPGAAEAIASKAIAPGTATLAASATRNGVPSSLVVVLVLIGLTALVVGSAQVRKRVLARRRR